MPGDEQKIENESTIVAEHKEVRQKQDSNERNAAELRVREERKRSLVAEAIKSNKTFQNIQEATSQNGIKLNLDRIVDIYLKLSADENSLQNPDYFNIDDESMNRTLQNVITTVNKTENGLWLHSNGQIDPEKSKLQRLTMLAEQNDAEFKKQYGEQLREDIFTFEKPEDYRADNILRKISIFANEKELQEFWNSEQGKKVAEKALYNDEETNKKIKEARILSNIENKEELLILKAGHLLIRQAAKTTRELTSAEIEELVQKLLELEDMLKDNPDLKDKIDVYDENGSIDLKKLKDKYVEFTKQYIMKENMKVVKSMGKNSYKNFTVEQKRETIEALITVLGQDDPKNRQKALLALTMIEGVTKWDSETRQIVVDEEGLIAEYNTVSKDTIKTMSQLKNQIAKNQSKIIDEHIEDVEKDFKVRTNDEAAHYQGSEKFSNNSNTYKENETVAVDEQNNNRIEEDGKTASYSKDSKDYGDTGALAKEASKPKKLTLKEKIDRKLRECYKKAKVYKASKDIDRILEDVKSGDEVKKALIIQSYQVISQPEKQMEKRLKALLEDPKIPDKVKKRLQELPKIEQKRDRNGKLPEIVKNKENSEQIKQVLREIENDRNLVTSNEIAKVLNYTSIYKAMQTMNVKRTKEFLTHYMAQDPENYGVLFGTGRESEHREINGNKVASYIYNHIENDDKVASYIYNHIENDDKVKQKLSDSSLSVGRIDEGKMIETITRVEAHEMTAGYAVRGGLEVAKDFSRYVSRRILASKTVMFVLHPIKGTKFLEEAKAVDIDIDAKRTETYNTSMNKIQNALNSARAAQAEEKAQQGQTSGEKAQPKVIPDSFEARYTVDQEELRQSAISQQQATANQNKNKEDKIVAIGREKMIEMGMDPEETKGLSNKEILEAMKKFNIVVELNEEEKEQTVPVGANFDTQGMDR